MILVKTAGVLRTVCKASVALVILSLLLSCNQQQESGTTTIVFKHGKVAGQTGHLSQLIDRFEQENPGLTVKEEILPSVTDQQHQFYVTDLEAGSADFDVFSIDVIWVSEFARAGWLEDLTERMSGGKVQEFLAAPLEACTFQGRRYAVPWFVDAGVLYYRTDLLEKYGLSPPETFAQLQSAAREILTRENDPNLVGFIWQGKQYEGLVCAALEFIEANCGHILDDRNQVALSRPEAVSALRYMRDLVERKIAPDYVTTLDEELSRHSFGSGRAIFMRNWPYAYSIYQQEGSKVRGKVGIKIMPHFHDCQSASTLGGWQLGINKHSRHKEAAWKLIEFLSNYESQKFLALKVGLKPSLRQLYLDRDLKQQQPLITDMYEVLTKAVPRPVNPFYPQISMVLQEKFSAVLAGTKDAKTALEEASRQIEEILSRLE
jgi:multiple sugar transport system substrate-binding protein